ncbi:MAG TPA: leucyl/phenylalanyl-tRNA--protein transferase [Marinilabiliales bacterium]|nr:MAG: leucyl/phenylalanyl-tRNA--protein transferase [Bacteroidetes bacterium GWA2_40_14]OFX59159.1 MAG: leucyl/phenylalanyl-tRNA--protein transferase [Bacteroidetes bacterium GWC2_40_13]OFX73118.1 MAG: leucyl/phenylalanyl-tRNA--protein transferase [Bacteroidetes bacterium GWD2_40_43]OFX95140.1 MAG: leucyl/phenylalanyl-tRNA--protein transferase [Bacteroidetes bacterium GWE2_40_63]OFY19223.1 MAG: leucyl/phenylalanyl-tRNA--protein transferase [Bacteroidetes bacterium GWF2_40_13]OFZ30805.1 MAG: 
MAIYQLPKEPIFPHPNEAEPNGLLAIGGDLSPQRLIAAYATGIFPWYSHPDPILWWSPNPRLVLFPGKFKVTKSLKQALNSKKYQITCDWDFKNVIENCQKAPRPGQPGTWITPEIKKAYIKLHELGLAHSIETWSQGKLVGGLYGISLGKTFFGESMFYKMTDASKVAFYYLTLLAIDWEFPFIDCQVTNPHLLSLGAEEIPRDDFLDLLHAALLDETRQGKWEIGFQR